MKKSFEKLKTINLDYKATVDALAESYAEAGLRGALCGHTSPAVMTLRHLLRRKPWFRRVWSCQTRSLRPSQKKAALQR